MIEILNLRDIRIIPKRSYDFICDRTSPLGNPFPMEEENQRDHVCDLYREYFMALWDTSSHSIGTIEYICSIADAYIKYGHVRLFCWCAPKRCHCETIREFLISIWGEIR